MTNQEQRIAIAEADGWTHVWCGEHYGILTGYDPKDGKERTPPNYPRDLNAMHEALMRKTAAFRVEFRACIFRMANDAGVNVFAFGPEKWAEAFISVLEAKKP